MISICPAEEPALEALKSHLAETEADRLNTFLIAKKISQVLGNGGSEVRANIIRLTLSLPTNEAKFAGVAALTDKWLEKVDVQSFRQLSSANSQDMPEGVRRLPIALQEAWLEYVAVKPPLDSIQNDKGFHDFQANQKTYWQLVEDLLLQRDGPWLSRLANFGVGEFATSRSSSFHQTHTGLLLMAAILEKNLDATTLATLQLASSGLLEETPGLQRWLKSVFKNPGKVLIGGLVDLETGRFRSQPRRQHTLTLLLRLQDEQAISNLVDLAGEFADYRSFSDYSTALLTQLRSDPSAEHRKPLSHSPPWDRRHGFVPVFVESAPVREKIFGWLKRTAETGSEEILWLLALELSRHPISEMKPQLEIMLRHSNPKIVSAATKALGKLGNHSELPPTPPPLKLRLVAGEVPFSKRTLMVHAGSKRNYVGRINTNEEGVLSVPISDLGKTSEEDNILFLMPEKITEASDPLFAVKAEVPYLPDKIWDINIPVAPLTFVFPSDFKHGGDILFHLNNETGRLKLTSPAAKEVLFPTLQHGRWHVEILAPGFMKWRSRVDVPETNKIEPKMLPGRDVLISIPDDPQAGEWLLAGIWKGTHQVQVFPAFKTLLFRGVPMGSYSLKIPGSDHHRRELRAVPEEVGDFAGVSIPLEITTESPLLIELTVPLSE